MTTTRSNPTSLANAASVNAKIGASLVVTAAGYVAGSFISIADTMQNHAAKNPNGVISHALTTPIKDQWVEARENGYRLVEEAKDIIDFSKVADKGETNEKVN